MAGTKTRKTKEELLKELEEKVKKVKADIKEANRKKAAKITKDSIGVAEAIAAIESAAKENKSTLADIIKAIASIKRTGLKIENAVRKPKA